MIRTVFVCYFLACVAAHAMPTVGDKAEWNVSLSQDHSVPVTGTVSLEIIGHDSERKTWKIREIQNLGEQQVVVREEPDEAMIHTAEVEDWLENCATKGGKSGILKLPAGDFSICEVQSFRGSDFYRSWIGLVPFGLAKTHTHYGEENLTVDAQLRSFAFGR